MRSTLVLISLCACLGLKAAPISSTCTLIDNNTSAVVATETITGVGTMCGGVVSGENVQVTTANTTLDLSIGPRALGD